jgi:hypothetical protein
MKLKEKVKQEVVELVVQLVHELCSKRTLQPNEISRLYYENSNDPDLLVEHDLVGKIYSALTSCNNQISTRLIVTFLFSELIGRIVWNYYSPIPDDELARVADEKVKALLDYSSARDIDIPIACLLIEGNPIKFGKATFYPIEEEDRKGEWWEKINWFYRGEPEKDVLSFARVSSPGDWEIASNHARMLVRKTLQVLHGIGLPILAKPVTHFEILDEFPISSGLPERRHKPQETIMLERAPEVSTRLGSSLSVYELNKYLLRIDSNFESVVSQILQDEDKSGAPEIENKLISGLTWIGEATSADTFSARYLKLSTALEFLIGGEATYETLSTRGITASLAERAAFLVGNTLDERRNIDKEIRKYYGLRSKLVHGQKESIDGKDFEMFGSLVRAVAVGLAQNLSQFKTIDQFQDWVVNQRYSLG